MPSPTPRMFLRLMLGDGRRFGPGKAELLERIAATGSISAAGRGMGMSYKRAWSLVEEMNASFRDPLVETARGGAGGGGAQLTTTGAQVLAAWRAVETASAAAAAGPMGDLGALLSDMSGQK